MLAARASLTVAPASFLQYEPSRISPVTSYRSAASAAVPTGGVDIAAATNVSMLENIANDPAQPAAKREAARTRIAQLRAASPAPAPAPAAPAPASETGMAFA